MNGHWQHESSHATSSVTDEQAQQNYNYWGYPAWSASNYYGSLPWLGVGGTMVPVYTSSPSSATLYPSSMTVYPSSSTTVKEEQQPLQPQRQSTEKIPPVELEREDDGDCYRRQSLGVQVDELIRALMPLPQSSSSSGAGAETGASTGLSEHLGSTEDIFDSPRLAELNIDAISSSQAIFYFGILAVQSLLLPRFQYSQDHQGEKKWACTLTMYGQTIVKPHLFESQIEVKTEICREALRRLMSQFPEWVAPSEPEDSSSAGWNWVELLQDYCVQNGLRKPQYTQYTHEGNYRHEVELEGGSFFGLQKQYPDVLGSKNAAAHMGLHALLVYGNGVPYSFPGPFTLKRSNGSLLAHVPRIPQRARDSTTPASSSHESTGRGVKRGADNHDASGSLQGTSKKKKTRGRRGDSSKMPPKCKNANLLPLAGSKLPDIEVSPLEEKRRWNVTPGELQNQLKDLPTQSGRLEKACKLLSLQPPEIRIKRIDGRLIETEGEYTAAAYFQDDPFLTRAGAIGSIKCWKADKATTKETCASEVVRYLIKMVNEDTILEAEEAAKRDEPEHWRENTLKMYANQGLLDTDMDN